MVQDFFLTLLDWWRTMVLLRGRTSSPLFKEGEIWWCSIGLNIGTEIFGKGQKFTRPVLIFKKFNKDSFLGIPLTSRSKEGVWYVTIDVRGTTRMGILSQIRVLDGKRLTTRIGSLTTENFRTMRERFSLFYHS